MRWPQTFATRFDTPRMERISSLCQLCRLCRPVVATDLDDPALADRLTGVEVLVHDPCADADTVARAGAWLTGLDEVLRSVDLLSPLAALLLEMIGARELALLRRGATVVDTARGAFIDTDALNSERASGRRDAILDVTGPEPVPMAPALRPLQRVDHPHVASSLGSEMFRHRRRTRRAGAVGERRALHLPGDHGRPRSDSMSGPVPSHRWLILIEELPKSQTASRASCASSSTWAGFGDPGTSPPPM
jgi:hypothetical protein